MPEARLLSRAFILCFAANLLQGLAFNLFLHFPGFLNELGASELEIGLIAALTAVAAIALRPPIGRMMDRRGRRPLILAGGLVNVLVVGLYLTVVEVGPWLYVVRIFHGLAEALLFSSLFTFAADWVPAERRTQGLAFFGVSGMLPISLGGVLGDWLLSVSDYSAIFLAAEVLAVASLLCSLPLRDLPREPLGAGAADHPLGLRAALGQRDLLPLWFIGTTFSLALTAVFVFIKRFVDETGLGSVGGFFTAYTAAALVLRVFFGWLPDLVGPKRVLLPALLALAGGFAALAHATGPSGVLVAGVLCGLGHGFTFPILFAMVVTRTPEANRGVAMAIFTALFDVGVLLGGPAFGGLVEWRGFAFMFAVGGVLVAVGSIVFLVWDTRVERSRRVARAAPVALLVGVGLLGCPPPGPLDAGLAQHREVLEGHFGHRLAHMHPYVWPERGVLWFLACRWPTGAAVGVSLEGGGRAEERALRAAREAWEREGLDIALVAAPSESASVRVEMVDAVDTSDGSTGAGATSSDCAIIPGDPPSAELVAARVRVAREAPLEPEMDGRDPRVLSDSERLGVFVHELGHVLGFQGHAVTGTVMAPGRAGAREAGRRVTKGRSLGDATLSALYALPAGAVLARHEIAPVRTAEVDRLRKAAPGLELTGPLLRVGDRAARVFWVGSDGAEYGFALVNLEETLRQPDRALFIAEEAARDLLGEVPTP